MKKPINSVPMMSAIQIMLLFNGGFAIGMENGVFHTSTCSPLIVPDGSRLAISVEPEFVLDHLVGNCIRAYFPPSQLGDDVTPFGRGRSDPISEKDYCGFTTKVDDSLIVAFHGTRCDLKKLKAGIKDEIPRESFDVLLSDVKVDLSVFGKNHPDFNVRDGIKVFPGFSRVVAEFYNPMVALIEDNKPFNEIFFTGHSMGPHMHNLLLFCMLIERTYGFRSLR